ncbi:FluC/FEX family fluoride channel [Nesterenkonia alkaliphila]|uniref:FluC/FEX family fluoride channel n=1 Tax=Nesterenkonia alkaliphila TaxID=1463631 RepID=UPI0012F790D1|nr:CrcB family protein [Nesterenkonia alkaliphila]GFZ84172.1 hypothetical protein GCM10011359_11280 [Nesterenkonia alkaliphila]
MSVELSFGVIAAAALGGAAGAAARFLLDRYLRVGVLIANTVGCLLMGALIGAAAVSAGAAAGGELWAPWTVGLLAFGFIGALSTFATVSLWAAQLWVAGSHWKAMGLWALHSGCGIAAAAAGLALGWHLAS